MRGAKKGERRGGRKVGTPNKVTLDLIETLKERGFDPAAELIYVYEEAKKQYEHKRDEKNGWGAVGMLDLARHAACDLMDFVYPKRKSIEHTGQDGKDLFQSFADLMKNAVDSENKGE